MKFIEKYFLLDTTFFLQVLTIVGAALITIITLNKDLIRSKTEAVRNEAKKIKIILLIVSFISIANVFVSNYSSQQNSKSLNDSLSALRKDNKQIHQDNGELHHTLDKNSIDQSDLINSNQQKSAQELEDAAKNLHKLINGSDTIPEMKFYVINDTLLNIGINNIDSLPLYNVEIFIQNYNSIKGCEIFKYDNKRVMSGTCFNENTSDYGMFPILLPHSTHTFSLPKYDSKANKGKYLMVVRIKSKAFFEEGIYRYVNHKFLQATRIVEFTNDKLVKKFEIRRKNSILKNVNWDKEFDPYYATRYKMIN